MARYKVTTEDGKSYAVTTEDTPETDWKQTIGTAAKDVFRKPAAYAKDLGTNPESMANAMPTLLGTAGGFSPVPGGATLGTGSGQVIRDLALKTLGKPIPSGLQHTGELGGAILGDVATIPAIKKSYFGGQIGKAERMAGMSNIQKEAPPSGARTAVKFIQGLKNRMNTVPITIQEARSIKPALDMIHQKGWLVGTEYSADLAQISKRVNTVVNQIPGRAEASLGMAKAMTIPRTINKLYQMIPKSVRQGIGYGTGVGAAGGASYELVKKLLGG